VAAAGALPIAHLTQNGDIAQGLIKLKERDNMGSERRNCQRVHLAYLEVRLCYEIRLWSSAIAKLAAIVP
jgi:hypothetical protein